MKISFLKIAWFVFTLLSALIVSVYAFDNPLHVFPLTELLATIISILIGISLSLVAILNTRPNISYKHYNDEHEKRRIEKVVNDESEKIQSGQFILFWLYYITLILAVSLKFFSSFIDVDDIRPEEVFLQIKVLSALFMFFGVLSLLWSANLPFLFKQVSSQRRNL